jgi:hypothetical protein
MLPFVTLFLGSMAIYCIALMVCARFFRMHLQWWRALRFTVFAFPLGFGLAFLLDSSGMFNALIPLVAFAFAQMVLGYRFLGATASNATDKSMQNGDSAAVAGAASFALLPAALVAFFLAAWLAPPGTVRLFH